MLASVSGVHFCLFVFMCVCLRGEIVTGVDISKHFSVNAVSQQSE